MIKCVVDKLSEVFVQSGAVDTIYLDFAKDLDLDSNHQSPLDIMVMRF